MDLRKVLAILLIILFCNKWAESVWYETGEHRSSSTSFLPVSSKTPQTTTINPFAEVETDGSEVKTTEKTHTTPETTRGNEYKDDIKNTSNEISVENKTETERTGFESTTVTSSEITKHTQIIKSTQASSDDWTSYQKELEKKPDLLTLLLNLTVTDCQENICERLNEPPENCQCDEICYFYNDCCYTMIEKLMRSREINTNEIAPLISQKVLEVENRTLMLRKDLIECVGNEYNESAFIMVSKCDVKSMTTKDVIEKCESPTKMYSIHNIPVDHIVNGKLEGTYMNMYCALCNGVPENETEFWTVGISCNVENVEVISHMEIEEIEKLEECVIRPKSLYQSSLRKCYIGENYTETCNQTHSSELRSLCQSYVYPGTNEDSNISPIYKNPHCASCQDKNVDVRNFHCVDLYLGDQRFKPGFVETPVNLKVVFDFSREKGLVSKVKCVELVKCEVYEIYDCASKRCRQLYCQRGETPVDGKCIKIANVTFGVSSYPLVKTFKPIERSVIRVNLLEISEFYILELSADKKANLVLYAMGETSENILKTIYNTIKSIYNEILESDQMKECLCLKLKVLSGEYDMITELFSKLILYFNNLEKREKRGYSLIPLFLKIRNFHSLDSLECATGKLIIDVNPSVVTDNTSTTPSSFSNMSFLLPSYDTVVYEQNSMWEVVYNTSFGVVPNVVATCDNRPTLNCTMLAYETYEVEISNTSVKIINTSLTFQQDEFAIYENKVFVCADRITSFGSFVNIFGFSAHHRVLSLVTSALSVFSAAIVVVAHCCMRRLRNIHGLNLSALSVSTILMHVLLIAAHFIEDQTICLVYAVSLHFVILNIFVWMNIIGFDMTRNLSSDKLIFQSPPYKRFLGYSLLSLAFPILVISVSISLDFTDSSFKPDYAHNVVCWLSNGKSILMFVIGPIVVSLLLSFSFFTFTIRAIYSKAKQSKFARNRSYLIVYLKLSLILGLTWIFGIVGAFAEQEWLWIVHIFINGLHGLSLLICSLVNGRMLRQFHNSLKSSTENSYNSKSAATEKSNI